MSTKILLVEDDALFGETISEFLSDEGYEVNHHLDASSAVEASYHTNYQLYLFDINLPTQNGIELLKDLRDAGDTTPTIYLTSSKAQDDLTHAFKTGCEDYLTKPVDLDELGLRIDALLRRVYGDSVITFDGFTLDKGAQTLLKDDQRLSLKPKAFQLLSLLAQHAGEVVTTEMIEQNLWEPDKTASNSAVRVYLSEIKQNIGSGYIKNIRGVGYIFETK